MARKTTALSHGPRELFLYSFLSSAREKVSVCCFPTLRPSWILLPFPATSSIPVTSLMSAPTARPATQSTLGSS